MGKLSAVYTELKGVEEKTEPEPSPDTEMGSMGQKINPQGFRLGTTQGHHLLWFAQPKNYSKGLQEDQKIRDCIKNYVQKKYKNVLWCRGNCTYSDSKKNQSDSGHNLYGIPKVISRR